MLLVRAPILLLGASLLVQASSSARQTPAGPASKLQNPLDQKEGLEVRVRPLKVHVVKNHSIQLHVEIWNWSAEDLFVCKWVVSGPCDLRVSFDPLANLAHGVLTNDCAPYDWLPHTPGNGAEGLLGVLIRDWVSIAPGHFYGVAIDLSPELYPELKVPGRYRVNLRFSSGGFFDHYCYYNLKPYRDELASLAARSWRGHADSNTVSVDVRAR